MNSLRKQLYFVKKYVDILNKDFGVSKLRYFSSVIHILFQLPVNCLYRFQLKRYKRKHNISKPIIHYYAVCWNEEKILPFMLDYYERFVDKFFIYDNYSTDSSETILKYRNDTEIVKFKMDKINESTYLDIKNNCWKKSRGKADYVIVCDVDEFLFHPCLSEYLLKSKQEKITFFTPVGYNMYSNTFPEYNPNTPITECVRNGVKDMNFNKSIIFDPCAIVEINYTAGAHYCYPWGGVKSSDNDELLLLHYKHLGVEYVLNRFRMYKNRLSDENVERSYGLQYLQDEQKITLEIESKIKESNPVI